MNFKLGSEERPLSHNEEGLLRQAAIDRAPAAMSRLAEAHDDEMRFYALPEAAFAAFHMERFELADTYAKRALELAPAFADNWNHGNAIHAAHTVLGLRALMQGDTPEAIRRLQLAGDTQGSPQLDTIGPTMQLAKALLQAGEQQAALDYLAQCRGFWKSGGEWLAIWEAKIRSGGVPNFFQHSFG